MGRGSQEKRMKTFFCSPRGKKDDKLNAHFKLRFRDENGAMSDVPDEKSISGYLLSIGNTEFTHKVQGKKDLLIKQIKLVLVDGDELFEITATKDGWFGRGIANAVIGTKNFDVLKIRMWEFNERAGLTVYNNDKKCDVFISKEEQAELVKEVENPAKEGEMMKVYKDLDKKLYDAWDNLAPDITKRAQEKGWLASEKAEAPPAKKDDSLQKEFDSMPDQGHPAGDPSHVSAGDDGDDMPF
jgi:hypothetical protein